MTRPVADVALRVVEASEPELTGQQIPMHGGAAILKRVIIRLEHERGDRSFGFADHADYTAHHEFTQGS